MILTILLQTFFLSQVISYEENDVKLIQQPRL
jgi:hypothetical protein